MSKINLLNSFKEFCKKNKFEINYSQIKVIVELDKFLNSKKNYFKRLFLIKKINFVFICLEVHWCR